MKKSTIVLSSLGLLLLIVALSVGGYLAKVALSGPKGQGDAIIKKNSAANWTAAQAKFEDLYQGVIAVEQKVALASSTLELNPDDKTAQQTLHGLQSACVDAVADYNAESRKYLAADFKAADLPHQITANCEGK